MRLMSPLISRILAVGVLGLAIALVYFATIRPVYSIFAAKVATIEQLEATVARYQRVEATSTAHGSTKCAGAPCRTSSIGRRARSC